MAVNPTVASAVLAAALAVALGGEWRHLWIVVAMVAIAMSDYRKLDRLAWWEDYTRGHNGQFNGVVGPGNQAGGLANIFEKSLGSAMKGGTTPLQQVYEYAEPIDQAGFVFMDSPGYDPVAVTGQIASGANLICFTTGRGSMFGSKPAPTIKLASNTPMFTRLEEDMDINCGQVIDGTLTIEEMGQQIFEHILRAASGESAQR